MKTQNKIESNEDESGHIIQWQNRLLPWIIIMPTLLAGLFIYLATQQLNNFNETLAIKPDSMLVGKILPTVAENDILWEKFNKLGYLQWITLTKLEQESLYRRYNQGGQLLMSRIYIKYLGFFIGLILAIVGAVFIIAKIKEDATTIEGTAQEKIKFRIVSSSPGVIFGFLGTILMSITILKHNDILIKDSPLYLNTSNIQVTSDFSDFEKNENTVDTTGMDSIWSIPEK